MIEIEHGHEPFLFVDRHIDRRLGADRLQPVGRFYGARVFFCIGKDDSLAALEIFDIGAVIAEMQHARK